ncbi:MAG: hypothetical protein JNJ45_09120 [Chthonomonas sp.]|nr:hypothetical protein [Chthonomonas sp.]
MKTRLMLPLLLVLVAPLAMADQKYDLARKAKVGDTSKQKIVMKMPFEGESFEYTMHETAKVVKVEEDGTVELEQVTEYVKLITGGETIDLTTEELEPEKATEKYAKNGKFLSAEDMDGDDTIFRIHHLVDFIRPDKVVGKGDEWTFEFDTKDRSGAKSGAAKFKFAEVEKVGSFECAKVTFSAEEKEGDKPATSEGTYWIRLSDGAMIKGEVKCKNFPDEEPTDAELTFELMP